MSLSNLRTALASGAGHYSPFFVLGDPTPERSLDILRTAIAAGATMLELGLPFSDPAADGPAIQQAGERAFAGGTDVDGALAIARQLRRETDVPFNFLVYGNLVHARGFVPFCQQLVDAGASSVLVPDIPVDECEPLLQACEATGLGLAQLLGPETSASRAERIGDACTAYLYLTGHQGITGASSRTRYEALGDLASRTTKPIALGFGLRRPEQIREAIEAGASVAIIGSALAKLIADHAGDRTDLLRAITEHTRIHAAAAASANPFDHPSRDALAS